MFRFKPSLQFKFVAAIIFIVVPLLGIVFLSQGMSEERQAWDHVLTQARVLTRQIILTRQWVSDCEGVYIPRGSAGSVGGGSFYTDILPTGRGALQRFTPSMVTKQLSMYSYSQHLYRFRLAGLMPMNPENTPTPFEQEAIDHFARQGGREYSALSTENGEMIFQYSAPLYVDKTCLSCHRNYTSGTVSGCLSVSIPVQGVVDALAGSRRQLLSFALVLTVLTVLTLYYLVRHLVLMPLNRLEDMADGISRGDFSTTVDITTGDEMQRLGRALDLMRARLAQSHSELEEKVRVATGDLAQANAELKTLDRMKTDFLATMSHELRSPLTSIRNGLDYLLRTETVEGKRHYLDILDKNLRRLMHLVTDIFDITRIEANKVQWHFTITDLTELTDEVLQIMAPQAESRQISLTLRHAAPALVDLDPERMEQVLVNLMDNAIKYSPPGGEIVVEVLARERETTVRVSDNGPGIAPENRHCIFKKFHTAPSSGTGPKPDGTGLGLAICSQIVRAHRGRIRVEDNPEGGSRFVLTLPNQQM